MANSTFKGELKKFTSLIQQRSVKYQPWLNFALNFILSEPIMGQNFKSKALLIIEILRVWYVYFID